MPSNDRPTRLDKPGVSKLWSMITGFIRANFSLIGDTSMGTTADTVTGAIAEHESDIGTIVSAIGNTTMGTTADTLTGAIAEHEGDLNDLNSKFNKLTNNLTIDGLTFGNKCTYVKGGYCRIYNLVIVEIRILTTGVPSIWDGVISGFPSSGNQEVPINAYNTDNQKLVPMDISGAYMRYVGNNNEWGNGNQQINISGIYLANSSS